MYPCFYNIPLKYNVQCYAHTILFHFQNYVRAHTTSIYCAQYAALNCQMTCLFELTRVWSDTEFGHGWHEYKVDHPCDTKMESITMRIDACSTYSTHHVTNCTNRKHHCCILLIQTHKNVNLVQCKTNMK